MKTVWWSKEGECIKVKVVKIFVVFTPKERKASVQFGRLTFSFYFLCRFCHSLEVF